MSDEERDDRNEQDSLRDGESDREHMRHEEETELRWLDLYDRMAARIETNEDETRRRDERIQRNIEFIVQQQAESQSRYERTEAIVERLATASLRRFEKVEGEVSNLDRKMEALVDSHIRMADTHKEAEERLNAFIATVERLINERRNGGSKGGVLDE